MIFDSMIAQGREIASWGSNVNVKVPVTNTKGEFAGGVILRAVVASGVVLNVTAIFNVDQVRVVAEALDPATPAIVSVSPVFTASPTPASIRCFLLHDRMQEGRFTSRLKRRIAVGKPARWNIYR